MGRDWIIDVLADLRMFARDNDMPELSAQLETAGLIAEVEIATFYDRSVRSVPTDPDTSRHYSASAGQPRRS